MFSVPKQLQMLYSQILQISQCCALLTFSKKKNLQVYFGSKLQTVKELNVSGLDLYIALWMFYAVRSLIHLLILLTCIITQAPGSLVWSWAWHGFVWDSSGLSGFLPPPETWQKVNWQLYMYTGAWIYVCGALCKINVKIPPHIQWSSIHCDPYQDKAFTDDRLLSFSEIWVNATAFTITSIGTNRE